MIATKLQLVALLFDDLDKSVHRYTNANWSGRYMNKSHGKTALKRKITLLRQSLLELEWAIENSTTYD